MTIRKEGGLGSNTPSLYIYNDSYLFSKSVRFLAYVRIFLYLCAINGQRIFI